MTDEELAEHLGVDRVVRSRYVQRGDAYIINFDALEHGLQWDEFTGKAAVIHLDDGTDT